MSELAIYDMDRTVTKRTTYTPFLVHCALRRSPWRFIFLPLVLLSVLAYAARLIDRGRLKEINQELLLGRKIHPRRLHPLVESFADKQVETNIRPGALKAIARDKAQGRRIVLATASYRLYADAIAHRLGYRLIGHKLDAATLAALDAAAQKACKPITDKRGTIEYRTKVAGVLARRAAAIAFERAAARA